MKKLLIVLVAAIALMAVPGCIGPMGNVDAGDEPDLDGRIGTPPGGGFDGVIGSSGSHADWSKVPAC